MTRKRGSEASDDHTPFDGEFCILDFASGCCTTIRETGMFTAGIGTIVGREGARVGRAALVGERTAQLLAARAEVGRETAGAVDNVLSCWRAKAAAGKGVRRLEQRTGRGRGQGWRRVGGAGGLLLRGARV